MLKANNLKTIIFFFDIIIAFIAKNMRLKFYDLLSF